jgi:hypothetical protein
MSIGNRESFPSQSNLVHQIDHLILGVADLSEGIAEFARLTGVEPRLGGAHPSGTHNALVALEDGKYLEILAPFPDSTLPADLAYITELDELMPIGWALRSASMIRSRELLLQAGLGVTDIRQGSRQLPNGRLLEWRTVTVIDPWIAEAPFLIEWMPDAPHPSVNAPIGCRLASMRIVGPQIAALEKIFGCLKVKAQIEYAQRARLEVSLDSPKGIVHFGIVCA